jgi:hypothetical protein
MAGYDESDDEEHGLGMFKEPEDFYQPEKQPTRIQYNMLDGREISLRLVGHNPLWVGDRALSFSTTRYRRKSSTHFYLSMLTYQQVAPFPIISYQAHHLVYNYVLISPGPPPLASRPFHLDVSPTPSVSGLQENSPRTRRSIRPPKYRLCHPRRLDCSINRLPRP